MHVDVACLPYQLSLVFILYPYGYDGLRNRNLDAFLFNIFFRLWLTLIICATILLPTFS